MTTSKRSSLLPSSIAAIMSLAAVIPLQMHAADPLEGNQSIIPHNSEPGNLSVAGGISAGGGVDVVGDLGVMGGMDFGVAVQDSLLPGASLTYLGGLEKASLFDITDALGTFRWRDNAGGTAREKMSLDSGNVLSLFNSTGSAVSISLNGSTGQINLSGNLTVDGEILSEGSPILSRGEISGGGLLQVGEWGALPAMVVR